MILLVKENIHVLHGLHGVHWRQEQNKSREIVASTKSNLFNKKTNLLLCKSVKGV
jgi:hypothetical protein